MSSTAGWSLVRERLSDRSLLGFISEGGKAVRAGFAKIGVDQYIQGISTSFTLTQIASGAYQLFGSATVASAANEDIPATFSISGLPAGTTLTDTATSKTGTLSSGTDTLSETVTGDNLQATLLGLRLVFQPGVTIPATITVVVTFSEMYGSVLGLPNETNDGVTDTGSATATLACFAPGTRVQTERGEVAVEKLREGDFVVTLSGGGAIKAVRWIGVSRIDIDRHPAGRTISPIRVHEGAFGDGIPHRDLLLSPDHSVYVDGVLIPVHCLVNGTTIWRENVRGVVTYYHVELDEHDVLVTEGLPTESYLDTGNRAAFVNGGSVAQLHPDFAQWRWEAHACAPIVVSGPAVESVRARLTQRVAVQNLREAA